MRTRFEQQLAEIETQTRHMATLVADILDLAVQALLTRNLSLSEQVFTQDEAINAYRFELEEACTRLIVTQQPRARDVRAITTVMSMIVDLERMGDQAKALAKIVHHLPPNIAWEPPTALSTMAQHVQQMLRQAMQAYAAKDLALAKHVAQQDDVIDDAFTLLFETLTKELDSIAQPHEMKRLYEILRAAQDLERFGDHITNLAERVIYLSTGEMAEMNTDEPPNPTA
jgi:phosphate transport system protein